MQLKQSYGWTTMTIDVVGAGGTRSYSNVWEVFSVHLMNCSIVI